MSKVDQYFKIAVDKILTEGYDDKDLPVRPVWPSDGTPAHTKQIHAFIARYNLQEEFPIMTLRKVNLTSCLKEIFWMYQKKSSVVSELGAHFWDAWQLEGEEKIDDQGKHYGAKTVGKTYGYQVGRKHQFKEGFMDQFDLLLWKLKNNPTDRRMIIDLWNNDDLIDMALPPCVYQAIFNVQGNKLNMTLIQRSCDLLSATFTQDITMYAILQCMVAQVSGLVPGELVHLMDNCHLYYEKHEEYVREICANPEYKAPKLWLNPEITNFYDFTFDDIKLIDYEATPSKKFEVAV